MKRKLTLSVLFIFVLASVLCTAFTVNADEVVYGDHVFDADRMMQFDEGTRFENGIVNGGIINPGTGAYSTYIGIKFDKTTYKNEECVKVELLDGQTTGYFDFNYYQHNAAAQKPVLDATSYPYLKIRYAYVSAKEPRFMSVWAAKQEELGTGGSTMYGNWGITESAGEWQEVVISLGGMKFDDGTTWSENAVRQFRIHMFQTNTDPDAVCYIAGFGFFESKAKAEAYNFTLEDNFVDITYYANGGFSAPEADLKQIGGDATLSKGVPGRLGYKFLGWATTADGEVMYQPGGKYTVDEPIKLYAQWEYTGVIEEGDRIFDADRMMQCDSGTHFRNGFLNGAAASPRDGLWYSWQGVGFKKTTHNDEPAIKVELLNGHLSGFLDFNYYAYDEAEGYKPALIGDKYPYFKIRYAYTGASSIYDMSLFASKATPTLGRVSNGEKWFQIQRGYGEWKEAVVDLRTLKFGDNTTWEDNVIRQFRVNLFLSNQNPDTVCYIAGMGFFETEEQARTYDFETGEYGSLIEYSANGGVCAPAAQLKEKDVPITLAVGVPAKRGYKFLGWSTSIDGEVEYEPGDLYTKNSRMRLYAVWEKDTDGTVKMGDHIFEGGRLIEYDGGTNFENGFTNGGEKSPVSGLYPTFTGVSLGMELYKSELALKVELLDGHTTGLLDFNYYQWNSASYKPSLDSAKYPYLRIRYAYENAEGVDSMALFAAKDANVLSTTIAGGQKDFDITTGSEWTDVVVDVRSIKFGDNTYWDESTVRQFRILPFEGNTNKDAVCYIAGFGFFETEEEARNYVFDTKFVVGDADGDGEVKPIDAIKLTRQLAGWSGYAATEKTDYTLDVTGDGSVNTLDLIYLIRHIAGWVGYGING